MFTKTGCLCTYERNKTRISFELKPYLRETAPKNNEYTDTLFRIEATLCILKENSFRK